MYNNRLVYASEKEITMSIGFVIKGNICQTVNPKELDLHEKAFVVCADGVSKGVFDTCPRNMPPCPFMITAMR